MNSSQFHPEILPPERRGNVQLTVIIPAFNEEKNLSYALDSVVGWANQVLVVDSYSTDRTLQIARAYDVETYQHAYENIVAQRTWASNLECIRNTWLFNLDADEWLPDELKFEIESMLVSVPADVAGFHVRRKHLFMGRWMKHGGDYIWLMRLIHRTRYRIVSTAICNEHTIVEGRTVYLKSPFVHENRKSLTEWMERQNRGSRKVVLVAHGTDKRAEAPHLRSQEQIEGNIRTFLNYRVYARLPLWLRPFVRFGIFYFGRLGFLDGWQGFVYHIINDFVHPFLVWAKFKELQQSNSAVEEAQLARWR